MVNVEPQKKGTTFIQVPKQLNLKFVPEVSAFASHFDNEDEKETSMSR